MKWQVYDVSPLPQVAEMETAMHQMQRQLDELQAVLKQNIALQVRQRDTACTALHMSLSTSRASCLLGSVSEKIPKP